MSFADSIGRSVRPGWTRQTPPRPHNEKLILESLEPRCLLSYTITDLGTLGNYSGAFGLNASGQVVGESNVTTSGPTRGFLYSDGQMSDLGTLGGFNSDAFAINDSAQVVGYADDAVTGYPHAFLYSDGQMQDLGNLGGISSVGLAINADGKVVGDSCLPDSSDYHAVLYCDGQITDLGTLGGNISKAQGINNAGQVVGYSDVIQGIRSTHAFIWQDGIMTDLGTSGYPFSFASAINDAGQVVGYAGSDLGSDYYYHAFLWQDGTMIDLGTLGTTYLCFAQGINDAGQIVGSSSDRAFVWDNGTMTDLNSQIPVHSGWTLLNASGINDGGQIAGWGNINGLLHAYLLTPDESTRAQLAIPANLLASDLTKSVLSLPSINSDQTLLPIAWSKDSLPTSSVDTAKPTAIHPEGMRNVLAPQFRSTAAELNDPLDEMLVLDLVNKTAETG
jgi:probable HAF family extracellular repeat protein